VNAPRGEKDDEGPSADLIAAIDEAARTVGGAPRPAAGAPPVPLRFDDEPAARRVGPAIAIALLLALAAASFLFARSREQPPDARVESDLRWAVGQVVRRVETLRSQTGRLPRPEDLQGLVSDMVVYEPLADGYWVHARRGRVQVEYDGSVSLERWLELRNP
jgi:hypothetical protein